MSAPSVIREATIADVEVLIALNRVCVGTPAWSEAIWRQMLGDGSDGHVVLLAEQDGVCAGFIVMQRVLDIASLDSIGVEHGSRGLGIGYALGLAAKRWAVDHAATAIQLEVRASNDAALGLYRLLGFAEQGKRKNYYSSPAEDGVLMELRLVEGTSFTAKV